MNAHHDQNEPDDQQHPLRNPYFFDSEVEDERLQFEPEEQDQRYDHLEKARTRRSRGIE